MSFPGSVSTGGGLHDDGRLVLLLCLATHLQTTRCALHQQRHVTLLQSDASSACRQERGDERGDDRATLVTEVSEEEGGVALDAAHSHGAVALDAGVAAGVAIVSVYAWFAIHAVTEIRRDGRRASS